MSTDANTDATRSPDGTKIVFVVGGKGFVTLENCIVLSRAGDPNNESMEKI